MKGLRKYLTPFAPDQSGAVSVLYELGGMLVICDAGGCTGNVCGFDEPRWFETRSAVFSAGLRDMDAILGRDDRLVAKLADAAEKLDVTFAAVIGTPVPAVIGTDYRALERMLAWQQVLTPAAESLNTRWRTAVVDGWNNAFSGRYPFKNVSSDASLPLLAKYLNTDTGRIARFLQNNLSCVLRREGNRWVPDTINTRGLTFNPAFLKAINTLSEIADVAFTTGNAGLHFELRPGTAAGVMQTTLITDNQKLIYVNQMPVWKRFTWPADTEAQIGRAHV